MDKTTLKEYWYELRGDCLFMYKREADKAHKSFIYLGIDSEVKPFESTKESEDGKTEVYGFDLISAGKTRKFFQSDKS